MVRRHCRGRVQVWVQVRAPAGQLAITPEGYSRRQSKVLTPKSMAKVLTALRHSLGGRAQTQGVLSRLQSLQAATGLLEENLLLLAVLTQFEQPRGSKRFNALWISGRDGSRCFHVNWNFRWNWREVVADHSRAHLIFLRVKKWHKNKTTYFESNPVQSSRFFEQFAFVNNHLLCYWPVGRSDQPSISRSRRSVLN